MRMGVLSDKDLLKLIKARKLLIHPILDKTQIQGGKIDLRLDNVFYLIGRFKKPYYDPIESAIEGMKPQAYTEKRTVQYGDKFILHPNDYALAPLFEFVKLPENVIGRLDGRSSLGRLGIVVHSTAGSVDPGYEGHLTMELMNNGMLPVALYPLMRVATLILTTLSHSPLRSYNGKYGKLESYLDIESRLHEDPDLKKICFMRKHL